MASPLLPTTSPAEVVRAGLAAHTSGDWPRLAALADPESLAEWSSQFIQANTHIPTLEELREECPEAPPERLRALVEDFTTPVHRFIAALPTHVAGVRTLEELHALSPTEVLLRFLQAGDKVARIARAIEAAYREAGLPLPDDGPHRRRIRRFQIRREELVSDDEARVAFVEEGAASGEGASDEWVLRRQSDGGWRVLVRTSFLYLPGASIRYFDDPMLLAYLRRQQGRSADETSAG
jgi:hypothetical protein